MHCVIGAEHPSLPGHFPGHPVVPGAVILSYVFTVLHEQIMPRRIVGVRRLKYLQQVLPGQTLRIEIGVQQLDRLPFKCWLGEDLAVDGQALLAD